MDNKKFNGGKRYNNSRGNDRPRNEKMTFPIATTYYTKAGQSWNEMDTQTVDDVITSLKANDGFKLLSVPVQSTRAALLDDSERRGFSVSGYITDFDMNERSVEINVYSTYVGDVKRIANTLYLNPRIISDRDGNFVSFSNFDLMVADQ